MVSGQYDISYGKLGALKSHSADSRLLTNYDAFYREHEMNTLLAAGQRQSSYLTVGCRSTAGKSAQRAKPRSQFMMGRRNAVQSGSVWKTGMGQGGATALGRAIT